MAAPTQNQEIQLGFGERPQGNAAALFGPNVFVIGGDDKSDIQQSIYAAATGFTSSGLGNKESWSNSRLALPNNFLPQTKSTCALAIQGGNVPYLFWAQPNAAVMATSLTDITQPSGESSTSTTANWSAGLVLCDENQAIMAAPDGACVSAVSLGSQAFLVAFPAGGNPLNVGAIGLYYVTDQLPTTMTTTLAGTFGIWPARAMRAFSALELGALLPAVTGRSGNSFGNMCSIAVTPQVNGTSADGNNPLLLNLVMLLTLTMEDHSGKTPFEVAVTCPLDDTGSPLTAPFALAWSSTSTTKSSLTLLSDPAGRLVACGSSLEGGTKQEEESLVFHLFSTYAQLQYLSQVTQPAQSSNTSTPAASLFIVDTANAAVSTSENATANGTMTSTSYPLLQLVFYGGTTVAQAISYGSGVAMANCSDIALGKQDGGTTVVVTAIIDGPLPMPDVNVIGWQFEGTNNDLGSIVYGTTSSKQAAVQQTVNEGVSLTSEGQAGIWAGAESLGDGGSAGIAWDFALNWSATRTWATSNTTTAAVVGQQSSMVSVVKEIGVGPVTPQIGQAVVPNGTFWSAGSSVSITNIKFLDAQGKVITDGSQSVGSYAPQAPIFASVTPQIGTSSQNAYSPFMVTPGDLLTYTIDGKRLDGTPCGINATMAALTNGEITDYFNTVIWPAAFDFAAGSDTPQKFLQFGWGLGAVTGEAFTAVQGTVNTSSWNIQASMAVGLCWNVKGGAPLFGGLETQGNLMIGGNAGYASSTTTTANDSWGVTIAPFGASPPWGPPNWGIVPETAKTIDPNWENDVVAQYTFALFFLPDPSSDAPAPLCPGYWVQELIKYGNTNAPKYNPSNYLPNNLDPGSGCWRIVYIVLKIQTYSDLNNDPPTYTYTCPDPRFQLT
jgi:hypothetical protein